MGFVPLAETGNKMCMLRRVKWREIRQTDRCIRTHDFPVLIENKLAPRLVEYDSTR